MVKSKPRIQRLPHEKKETPPAATPAPPGILYS
jgi:hypothetical protein